MGLDLQSILYDGAEWAAAMAHQVVDKGPLYAVLFPYLSTYHRVRNHAVSTEREAAVHDTILTHSFCIFSCGVTRNEVGDETEVQVAKTTENVVTPRCHIESI